MSATIDRRKLLKQSLGLAAASAALAVRPNSAFAETKMTRKPGSHIKIGLNAYSFDQPLRAGSMTYDDVIQYCAEQRIDGLDATGYYFPGYPKVPSDEYIAKMKRTAFLNGVTISGTGVRNDFAVPDAEKRKSDVQLVKDWIEVAAKLGASEVRVFSGARLPEGHTFDQVLAWMVPAFKECAAYGKRFGIIVALQQHNDFLKTADETIRVINAVDSEWFAINLDVGSLRRTDPYPEIEKLVPYAVTWQIKQTVWYDTKEVPTDLPRIKSIIDKVGYRGFVPIEALGGGDARQKVTQFLAQVRQGFGV